MHTHGALISARDEGQHATPGRCPIATLVKDHHRDDEHEKKSHRGAGAALPDAGAAVPASAG